MWQEKDNTLYRKFEFTDFTEAFAFMTRVVLIAVGENELDVVKTIFQKEGLLEHADPIGRFRAAAGKSVYVRP